MEHVYPFKTLVSTVTDDLPQADAAIVFAIRGNGNVPEATVPIHAQSKTNVRHT